MTNELTTMTPATITDLSSLFNKTIDETVTLLRNFWERIDNDVERGQKAIALAHTGRVQWPVTNDDVWWLRRIRNHISGDSRAVPTPEYLDSLGDPDEADDEVPRDDPIYAALERTITNDVKGRVRTNALVIARVLVETFYEGGEEFLTVKQIAKLTGLSESQVRRVTSGGHGGLPLMDLARKDVEVERRDSNYGGIVGYTTAIAYGIDRTTLRSVLTTLKNKD